MRRQANPMRSSLVLLGVALCGTMSGCGASKSLGGGVPEDAAVSLPETGGTTTVTTVTGGSSGGASASVTGGASASTMMTSVGGQSLVGGTSTSSAIAAGGVSSGGTTAVAGAKSSGGSATGGRSTSSGGSVSGGASGGGSTGATGEVTLIASLKTTTDAYIEPTWKNDSKVSIFLYGCGTVDVWKQNGAEWKNVGKTIRCTWEGASPEVPAGTSYVDTSAAYGPVFKTWGAGTYRVKGTYGVGCTNPTAGQSKAGCTAFHDAVSNEVVVSTPPPSADAGIDAACGPMPDGVTCKKPTGGCVAMTCNNGSWSCAPGQTPVALVPGACDVPDGAAGFAPDGLSSIETISVHSNGGDKTVTLSRPIQAPLGQEDAELVRKESGCGCSGELVLKESTWTSSCCVAYPDCSIKIDEKTGAVTCELYG